MMALQDLPDEGDRCPIIKVELVGRRIPTAIGVACPAPSSGGP